MNGPFRRFRRWAAGGAAALLVAALPALASKFTVDALPELPPQGGSLAKPAALALLRFNAPADAQFLLEDARYFLISRAWAEKMFAWTRSYIGAQLPADQIEEYSRDRPHGVAMMYKILAAFLLQQKGTKGEQAMIGVLTVECHGAHTQVAADGHLCAYVVFGTGEGFFVHEPASGLTMPLVEMPSLSGARFQF
jgi:hypothetical protein